jgi:hypothetical protein
MSLDVYLENQLHERTHAGPSIGIRLERVLEVVDSESLLWGIHLHGDTMFNSPQLARVMDELDSVATKNHGLREDVEELKALLAKTIKNRGYVWVSGD